jgi:hypothetical protein
MSFASAFFALVSWNPEIRNILALSVGVGILMGSVILLISTNTGPRTGVLIGLAALFGWMTILGMMWWMYTGSPASLGGMKGTPAHWRVVDVNVGDLTDSSVAKARQLAAPDETKVVKEILAAHPELEAKVNPEHKSDKVTTIGELVDADPAVAKEFHLTPDDLNGWHLLVPSNPVRGDAQSTADAELGPDGKKLFKDSSSYKVLEAYDIGGKENDWPVPAHATCDAPWQTGCIHHVLNWFATSFRTHPEHFALVQVQGVIPVETPPGGTPPTPQLDPKAPIITVVMIRSLGDVRFPGFVTFVVFGTLFAITCNTLHRRDKRIARNRAAA